METKKNPDTIDLRQLARKIWARKMLFVKVLPVVFVLSCLYIVCIPRTYTTNCRLAPEMNMSGGGALGSLASNFGIDLTQMETSDAITPMLYPDLMEDNKFVVELFGITVKKSDGCVKTTYEDYLRHHQSLPWWTGGILWIKGLFKSKETESTGLNEMESSPYILSKADNDLCHVIRGNIGLDIDKKTGVISINVSDQDPLVCKTVADSVSAHLQQFITEYRTNKARVDVEYYLQMSKTIKEEYDSMRREYNSMVDANSNVVMQLYKSRQEDMGLELQRIQQKYTTMCNMLDQAVAKVQERTPVFTVLKGAEMPLKAAKPKRMVFVIGMVFLAAMVLSAYIIFKGSDSTSYHQ